MNKDKKNSFDNITSSFPLIIFIISSIIIIVVVILFTKFFLLLKFKKQIELYHLGTVLSSTVVIIGIFSYIYQYYSDHNNRIQTNSLKFTELTKKGVLDLELFFMKHNNDLQNLYYEMYSSYGFPKPEKHITLEQRQVEFHAVSYMIQVMEDVWVVLDLDKNYDNNDYLGWMNTFKKWGSSKTFIIIWNKLKNNYGLNFIEFVELHILFIEEESEY
jgi:hypothetical protein